MILKIRNEKGEWIAVDVIKGEPGADGYTPIKGVDYFDGVDGKDGQDGYTPIKGIDYFDGKDGLPGKDGKDGTITFEELTPEQKESLKGADGAPGKDGYTPIKGIDYFDGAPGKDGVNGIDGKDGVDGKDYILTDADKQEIAAMVEVTGGGEGGKDSFFIDFTNATGDNQACDADMLEFINYFQENDDCCINIRDGLNSEAGAGYYYPGLIQTTNKAKSINLLKAVINLNTVNDEQEFRIYNLNNVNGSWFYKYVIGTYNYQLVTSKNIKNYGYLTEEEVIALIEEHGGGGEALPSAEGAEF